MDLHTALAQATDHGWSNDSRYLPSFLHGQVSLQKDGFLAAITIRAGGAIHWGICSLTGHSRSQRGTARTIPAAMDACDAAIASANGTLF